MKVKKIRTKMLVTLLPAIILAMTLLTAISSLSCTSIIKKQIRETMDASLDAEAGSIEDYLKVVQSMAMTISRTVGTTYQEMELSQYEAMLGAIIQDNDMVLGSGIWFEPYVYDKQERYVGPYIFKDGSRISVTYDYSNASYDYFSQEYYTAAKASAEPMITDPYYDPTSDTIMSSCSMPIYDGSKFIGCVTVDVELSSIEAVIDHIRIGDGGTAFLLSENGTYLAGVETEKITGNQSVLEEENDSLAEAGRMILNTGSGETSYRASDKTDYNLYYSTILSTGWHIVIQMPKAELLQPMLALLYKLLVVAAAALLVCCLIVLLQVSSIARSIRQVQIFAENLAKGDFTIHLLEVSSEDELGTMGNSLNDMYQGNREVISNIAEHSAEIAGSSSGLKASAGKLQESFQEIQNYMAQINAAMMSASAATEEVNASVEGLASETKESMKVSQDIRQRAVLVEKASRSSYQSASQLSAQFEQRLSRSIENSRVVENIGQMAKGIAGIAEQINMLSLNASIEAARAGAQGKGFAVVAGEIGSLAGKTAELVKNIQTFIGEVQAAFEQLSGDSKDLLAFIQDTVTPDYNQFVETAEQYGRDAEFFFSNSDKISNIMEEVKSAIQNIAEAAQNTAETGGRVMASVDDVSEMVKDVGDMSEKQQEIADNLDAVVRRFQL